MIIGIDETGDFRDDSRAWFVAVLIRPSAMPAIEGALRRWERDTRLRLGLANEIKGARIDPVAAMAFVTDVIGAGDGESVRWIAFAVDVHDASCRAMAVQRQILVDGYEGWAKTQATSDDPERHRFGRVLQGWADWLRARDERQMLKLATLARILPELLELAFGLSIAGRHDHELVELSFRVDRGYIKRSELTIWRDILRNVFIDGTRNRPIPFSSEWSDDHPVFESLVENGSETMFSMKPSFKERIDFYDSVNTPAIRVADVLAAIVRRGIDGGSFADALRLLRTCHVGHYPYVLLEWTGDVPEPGPNPYLTV